MRAIWLLLVFAVSTTLRADALPERDQITIDLKRDWEPSPMDFTGVPDAVNCNLDLSKEYPTFTSNQPRARATFQYDFDLPIEMTEFPTFVLKYRAKNIDINNTWTCIWIIEGDRSAIFPLIDFDKLTVDGKIHEIQIDLPKAPVDSKGTPFENGPVKGLLVSVLNKDPAEGSIELISAEFRSATETSQPAVNDDPIHVHVTDDSGKDVKGAKVIVDAERKEAAQNAKTDAQGLATLTPIKNELNRHAIHVEADGGVPVDLSVDPAAAGSLEIALPKPMRIGGSVEDGNGRPLANATVNIYLPEQAALPTTPIRRPVRVVVRTDPTGQWIAPPLPWTDQIRLHVCSDKNDGEAKLTEADISMDELRSDIATIRLKK